MSSIIFSTEPTLAIVATDTLATDPEGKPLLFCSKAVYIPHIRTIIAGTGLGGFSNNWANFINGNMVIGGLRNLDYHTPSALRERWSTISQKSDFILGITTTVYQIGVSEDDQEICAYAYRSTNDFKSEPLKHGIRMKPDCQFPDQIVPDGIGIIEAIRPMMEDQRKRQSKMPPNDRLYIGGQCVVMILSKDTCTTATLFDFDDYKDQLNTIFAAY